MLKLRTILLYDQIYLILVLIILLYAFIDVKYNIRYSKYLGNEKVIVGYLNDYYIDGNKLTINLKAQEIVIGNYYFKTVDEKNNFIDHYFLGDQIKLTGLLIKPKGNTVFNLFDYHDYLYHHHIYYLFKIENIIKISNNHLLSYQIKQTIINRINHINNVSNYLKTFIMGNTKDIDNNTLTSYQIIGISHLFAISGMHIGLLSIILLTLLTKLKIAEAKRYLLVTIFLLCYMYLTNYSPSVMRATIFFILYSINKIYYFNIKSINIFFLTLSIVVLIDPHIIYDIGFQFSFTISFYLILFQALINKYNSYLTKLLMVSFIAFMSSLPIVIVNFYQINIFSIIFNLIFVPLISIIIFPLSLITFILPFLANLLILLINIMEYLALSLSHIKIGIIILSKPNLILIVIYYIVITYTLYVFRYQSYYFIYIIFLIAIHHLSSFVIPYPSLTMIDVGQGDAILIRLPFNQGNILIDTGGKQTFNTESWTKQNNNFSLATSTLIPYFKSIGITSIDYLIITHHHDDHIGEALNLINNFKVKHIILNKSEVSKQFINHQKINHYYFGNSDILTINKYKFYFLNPSQIGKDLNDNSLVIYTVINNKGVLLTGDISSSIEKQIINEYKLKNLYILKVAHHGSDTSTSELLLKTLRPKYALISVGLNNKFNHPSQVIIDRLNNYHIKTYLTSKNGSIYYRFYTKTMVIKLCPS